MSEPILLNSCARAATAAEARFRIQTPIRPSRGARVVALDGGALEVVGELSNDASWVSARFFSCEVGEGGGPRDVRLVSLRDDTEHTLAEELDGADVAVLVATVDDGAVGATLIGEECVTRGIMTAGFVLGDWQGMGHAVVALRPRTQVLMLTSDVDDVSAVLTALRA